MAKTTIHKLTNTGHTFLCWVEVVFAFFSKKSLLKRLMGDKLAVLLCLVVTFYSAHLCSQCSVYPPQLSLISLVCAILCPMSLLIHLGLRLMSGRSKRKWTKWDWPNNVKLETIVPTETRLQHNIPDQAVQASGQTDRVPGRRCRTTAGWAEMDSVIKALMLCAQTQSELMEGVSQMSGSLIWRCCCGGR